MINEELIDFMRSSTSLIYAPPTSGKTTLIEDLRQRGVDVVDTDDIIEHIMKGLFHVEEKDRAWSMWRLVIAHRPQLRMSVESSIKMMVRFLQLVKFTNLHFEGCDLSFARKRVDARRIMLERGDACSEEELVKKHSWISGNGWLFNKNASYHIPLKSDEFIFSSEIRPIRTVDLLKM